ncbi:hypothetical protein Acsp04_52190 [Actinomadura sp. NBRC 104425]|uniref:hypothetical protein n=1 Tax=Actinomadura sp. NBRC 104425 TaxID=3032204 RepID=UPI0024A53909|nr:hypothetical protein [Actinomadura sp. NBRC 104425]GLZ14984.1 hypothetical protein Acsp04_52190 [Actinomadura sp. NBRC 104425]
MAETQGFVQRFTWLSGPMGCAWVGADEAHAELLTLAPPESGDSGMGDALVEAALGGWQVHVLHDDDSARITGVRLPAPDVVAQPLQMDAMEVTQAIQDLSHSVPLIARKRTVVRVYLSYYGTTPVTVSGELAVRHPSNGTEEILLSENTATLNPADAGNVALARSDASRTLNFVLQGADVPPGRLTLRVNRVTDALNGASLSVGGERRPVLFFHQGAPLRVRVIGFTYQWGTPPTTIAPTDRDFRLLLSWLGRAYPVAEVQGSQGIVAATADPPFGCGAINAQLAAIRAVDVNAGTDARTHYYGLVGDAGFFMRGCAAGIPSAPAPETVASGPTGPNSWGWDFDGSYGDWYGGHEIGHTLGRLHPGFCGESQDDLNHYPFPAGQLSATDDGFAGFDVGDPANALPLRALPGPQWHDCMTYCDRQWLSVYTYLGILERLRQEDALPSGAGRARTPRVAAAGGGGRPDQRRFPDTRRTGPAPGPRAEEAGGPEPEEAATSVVARVDLTGRRGTISHVNAVPNLAPTPPSEGAEATVRVVDPDGRSLMDLPVPVKLDSELGAGDNRTGLVDAVVAVPPGAAAIELLLGDQVVDTFRLGGPPPRIGSVRVLPADDGVRVAVDLDRPAEAGQTFALQVSEDGGATWQTVGVSLDRPPFHLPQPGPAARGELLFKVIATNGVSTSEAVSAPTRLR